jgi:hypothetical protein
MKTKERTYRRITRHLYNISLLGELLIVRAEANPEQIKRERALSWSCGGIEFRKPDEPFLQSGGTILDYSWGTRRLTEHD